MPYYVHPEGEFDPHRHPSYLQRKQAYESISYWTRTWSTDQSDVKPVVVTLQLDDDDRERWRYRELDRFSTGLYQRVPWHTDGWWTDLTNPAGSTMGKHYVHLSVKHAGLVAYTPDDEAGINDKQICVRPGKYLRQFAPFLTKQQIDVYCAACIKNNAESQVKWAHTADDIVAAYQCGPQSCMDAREFPNAGSHPCRAYGDSDFSLAYIGRIDGDDPKVKARAIVWRQKRTYARVYGHTDLLFQQLEALGYTVSFDTYGAFLRGVKVRGSWLMPYVDGDCETCNKGTDKNGRTVFVLCEGGEYSTKDTSGHLAEVNQSRCEQCGAGINQDERYCESCLPDTSAAGDCGAHCMACGTNYNHMEHVDCPSCAAVQPTEPEGVPV